MFLELSLAGASGFDTQVVTLICWRVGVVMRFRLRCDPVVLRLLVWASRGGHEPSGEGVAGQVPMPMCPAAEDIGWFSKAEYGRWWCKVDDGVHGVLRGGFVLG